MSMKIMLDAGHDANYNQSPVYPDYWESKQMWILHLFLKKHLEENYEVQVDVTRHDQIKDLCVTKRGELAKGYDLFLSLHSNASSSPKTDRVDIFYSYENHNNAKAFAEILAQTIAEVMNVSGGYAKTRKSTKGDWEYYGVLRGAASVGCPLYYIVEHSFHTNEYATKWLMDNNNLDILAKAEAELIAKYFNLKSRHIIGDVNPDGKVDMFDSLALKSAILGNKELTEDQVKSADINQDGRVNMMDYLALKQSIMKPITDDSKPAFNIGDTVKINDSAETFANGKVIKDWVKKSVLYIRDIESDGEILLLSVEKDKPEYTGRFRSYDVHKV